MSLQAYIEAVSDSDFAPLSFFKQISDHELNAIEQARQLLNGPIKSIALEGDMGTACCTADTERRMLVTQHITVFADHIVFSISDPVHEIEFDSRPIALQELTDAIARSANPNRASEVFLGFNEDTGVLPDLLDEEFGDRDLLYPISDRQLTAGQLALVYGTNGQHAALQRAQFKGAADKGSMTYWEWLDSQLGQIDAQKLQQLNSSCTREQMAELRKELERLETAFQNAGGRGVDLAEEIDSLREKIEALESVNSVQIEIPEDEIGLALPPSDRTLNAEQLAERYREAGEHGAFPKSDWEYEVANEGGTAGYWTWLEGRVQLLTDEEVEEINSSIGSSSELNGPGY